VTEDPATRAWPDPIAWRRSRSCESGACVEVAFLGESVGVRNSESPGNPMLTCTSRQWEVFVAAVQDGAFNAEP
jgi:hypothetical protein